MRNDVAVLSRAVTIRGPDPPPPKRTRSAPAEIPPVQNLGRGGLVFGEDFLEALDRTRTTREVYRRALRAFFKWYTTYTSVTSDATLNADLIRRYRDDLAARGLSPLSIALYLTSVRRYFDYLVEQGHLPANPAKSIRGIPKPHGHLRDNLMPEQVRRVLDIPDTATAMGKRDHAILLLMVKTGMRTIEVRRANVGDLRAKDGEMILAVQGKGRAVKDEFVVLLQKTYDAVMNWLGARGELKPDDPLFVALGHNSSGRMSCRTIHDRVSFYLKRAGIKSRTITPHSLRHTAATLAIQGGANLLAVKSMMRHENVNTTLGYVHEVDRIRNGAERFIERVLDEGKNDDPTIQ